MSIRKSEGTVSEIVRIADASARTNSMLHPHRNDRRPMTTAAEEQQMTFPTRCKDRLDNSNDDRRGCSRRIERNSRSDRRSLKEEKREVERGDFSPDEPLFQTPKRSRNPLQIVLGGWSKIAGGTFFIVLFALGMFNCDRMIISMKTKMTRMKKKE